MTARASTDDALNTIPPSPNQAPLSDYPLPAWFRYKFIDGLYNDDRGTEGDVREKPKYEYEDSDGYKIVIEVEEGPNFTFRMKVVSVQKDGVQHFRDEIRREEICVNGYVYLNNVSIERIPVYCPTHYYSPGAILIRAFTYAIHALFDCAKSKNGFLFEGRARITGYSKPEVLRKFTVIDVAFRLNGFKMKTNDEYMEDEYEKFNNRLDNFVFILYNGRRKKFDFTFNDYVKEELSDQFKKHEAASSEERAPPPAGAAELHLRF